MAAIEIQRIIKLMQIENKPITSFEQLQEIIDTTYKLIQPKFMKISMIFLKRTCFAADSANVLHIKA